MITKITPNHIITEKKGFSLVELLVVITIIAILSVVAYSAIGGQTIKAKDAKRKQDLGTMQSALELYFIEYSKYPAAPLTNGLDTAAGQVPKKILSEIPVDPGVAGHSYLYKVSGATYEIGATLENDGALANYESYVVGNSDNPLLNTSDGEAKYYDSATTTLKSCTGAKVIGQGAIQTSNTTYTAGPPALSCVPYDPAN